MKPETAAWVAKAEADFATAQRELRARKSPNFDSACFHAQQCAEKYLKARLVEAGIAFPKTHSLTALLHLLLTIEPTWVGLKPEAAQLTIYAIEFRYPGKSADRLLATEAVAQCKRIRDHGRASLGLPVTPARRAATARRQPAKPPTRRQRRNRK